MKTFGNEEDRRMNVIRVSPSTEVVHQTTAGRREMTTEVMTVTSGNKKKKGNGGKFLSYINILLSQKSPR